MNFVIIIVAIFSYIVMEIEGQQGLAGIIIGQPCKVKTSKKIGFCKRPENCRNLKEDPELSSAKCLTGTTGPIICCPDQPLRISERKCLEYHVLCPSGGGTVEVLRKGTVETGAKGKTGCGYGGDLAKIGEFPHTAAIGWLVDGTKDQIDFKCGGTMIAPNYIVTAAHCLATDPYLVRLGGVNISNKTRDANDILITKVYIHPNYTSRQSYNDIALLRLNRKAYFFWKTAPACLWTNKKVNYKTLAATGYGQTSFGGPNSDDLIKLNLTLYNNSVCNDIFSDRDFWLRDGVIDTQVCAGREEGKQDTCPGDSGGPLGVKLDIYFYILGVTSFGNGCGGTEAAVYTRVTSYVDWIESIVWTFG